MTTTNSPADRGAPQDPPGDDLFTTLYAELHRIARREVARRGTAAGVSATTVLHEAYLAMNGRSAAFPDRERFLGYASRVMRGLIIDEIRARHAQKRGGDTPFTTLCTDVVAKVPDAARLARIGDAIDELATHDPLLAEVVDLKFFCGFSVAEIAAMRGVSDRTIARAWEKSRLYLHRAIGGAPALV